MSKTQVLHPIQGCLTAAEQIPAMGPERSWLAQNHVQNCYLSVYQPKCIADLPHMPEVESIASLNVAEVTRFMQERGFNMDLGELEPGAIAAGSVLKLLVEWLHKGTEDEVRNDGTVYPAVHIQEDNVAFFTGGRHNHPIARLRTKTDDAVYMTMWDMPPSAEGFMLSETVQTLRSPLYGDPRYAGLTFPMVDLDQDVDISWLEGMRTIGDDGQFRYIGKAMQKTRLRMNEVGAKVESGVTMGILLEAFMPDKTDHIIDKPFLMWIERSNLLQPIFIGYITPEDWKKPTVL